MNQPAIATATPSESALVLAHVAEFTELGYTILRGAHDPDWVRAARAQFEPMRQRQPTAGGAKPVWLENLLELEPELALRAITRERVLAVAEGIIGPHVQVESMTFVGIPPMPRPLPPDCGELPGWHRDLFARFPAAGVYQQPLLFNAMSYLQDLTDAIGPLRVIPGSHRRPLAITAEQKPRHHPEQVVLYPQAGDVVLFHHALLHSGSHNQSDETRFFFCVAYNHCWLKYRSNYSGPACLTIIRQARERGDRRLLRLLGADDQVLARALYDHVLEPEAGTWARWMAEERAAVKGA